MAHTATTGLSATDMLAHQVGLNYRVLQANVTGVSHEESLTAPQAAGNCLNWVVGHVLVARNQFLRLMGRPPVMEEDRLTAYRRGQPPLTEPDRAVPFGELVEAIGEAQAGIVSGLEGLTVDQLARKAPFSPGGDPDETVGSLAAALVFHEAYHAGQAGLLRRVIGKTGALS